MEPCSKDVGAKRTKLGNAGLIRDQRSRTAFDNDADAGLTKLSTGQKADAGLFLGIPAFTYDFSTSRTK